MSAAAQPRSRARGILGWCLFDWANSPFPTIVSTFVFPTYFVQAVAPDEVSGQAWWSLAMSAAGIITALLGPALGAIADHGGARKPWIAVTCAVMVIGTASLWFVAPGPNYVLLAMVLAVVATVGFELSMVFYNALLPEVAPPDKLGRVSGWGWGLGYAGGLAALLLALVVLLEPDVPPFGLNGEQAEPVRATVALVALWFAIFSVPFFVLVPDRAPTAMPLARAVRAGLAQLGASLRRWREWRGILRFLIAFLLYSNGINTLFALGAVYAATTFAMSAEEVVLFGIALNIAAGLGAASFAWVDDWLGAKPTLLIAVGGISLCGSAVLMIPPSADSAKLLFWVFGLGMSVFFGPAQAASRSLMARMAPEATRTEMFGLYGLAGRVSNPLGTAAVGWVTLVAGNQRIGMATILVFLFGGLALLFTVREPKRAPADTPK